MCFVFQKLLSTRKIQHSSPELKFAAFASVEYIGRFLDSIFEDVWGEVPMTTLPAPKPGVLHCLHYAPGYNQELLMELVMEMYEGNMPQSFQVFRCHEMSTEEEISFFFQKVEGYLSMYTILEVNRLTMPLQQVLFVILGYLIIDTRSTCAIELSHITSNSNQ